MNRMSRAMVAFTTAFAIFGSPMAASAFVSHEYSIAYESTGGAFDGIKVERTDANISPPGSGSGCYTYFAGNPVYQTEWVQINIQGTNWEELGTADQCQGFDFTFWGYGLSNVWHPLGESATPGAGTHTFSITRASGVWTYKVDGVSKGSDTWNEGVEVSTGLESYANMTIPAQQYGQLIDQTVPNGAWHSWSGRDIKSVGADMCGRWNADDDWRAAEAQVC